MKFIPEYPGKSFSFSLIFCSIFIFQFSLFSQPSNDNCETAIVIQEVFSDAPFVCIDGTNLLGTPEVFNNQCSIGEFSTVWFKVFTDGNATLMNIGVTSSDFDVPTITLFHELTDCNALQPVPLTSSNFPCIVGSGGEAEAIGSDVGANAIYYIAVSSLNHGGGEFELCVNTISVASACVVDRSIEITSRSSGGPLEGPFFPGETVGICMNVNSYTAANNGCQWFQGLIPVFGNGWDPASFDANGQPLNTTINGNPMGVLANGVYGASTWDYFTDVDYHFNNVFHQVGDFDGNGTVDMCSTLYGPDCPNVGGLNGGCCNPCWGAPLGTILPGGWFAYGINGSCATPGPPVRVDWGDGNTCGGGMGPWSFCFDLIIRDFPDCAEDNTTMDLSLGFFTTADGETGSWTGSASICALDQPAHLQLPFCCSEFEQEVIDVPNHCSGEIFEYTIDESNVDYWEWTVVIDSVAGAYGGSGFGQTFIHDTLVNLSTENGSITYQLIGYGGSCPVFFKEINITVVSSLSVSFDQSSFCATPDIPYELSPEVSGCTGNYEYIWFPGGETTPSIFIPNPVNGTTYCITVSDGNGTTSSSCLTLDVYSELDIQIQGAATPLCAGDTAELQSTSGNGNSPFDMEWLLPNGSTSSEIILLTDVPGQYISNVTDAHGCAGADTVVINFNEIPVAEIISESGFAICSGESVALIANIQVGLAPYSISWLTPNGIVTIDTLITSAPGEYQLLVTDANGCESVSTSQAISLLNTSFVDLGPDTIYVSGSTTLDAGIGFTTYIWNTGQGTQTIEVNATGDYIVNVIDGNGCSSTDTIHVEIITGINTITNSSFLHLFPNPTTGILTLQSEMELENIHISIKNIDGKEIHNFDDVHLGKNGKELDLSNYTKGVYIILVSIDGEMYIDKIILQ